MTHASPDSPLQGAVPLTHWGAIRVQGEDAASFLHGQLTQDIANLKAGQLRLAGYCSAKGRLLATFLVWRPQPDTVWLLCRADLLATTLKRLSMFVLRARCKLFDASAEMQIVGLVGNEAARTLRDAAPGEAWQATAATADATVLRLPDVDGLPRFVWMAPVVAKTPELPALPFETWRLLEVRSGIPMIGAATTEQFVPQMVNLEAVDGVNFKKGCYPGQEVVARSQYRGTLKRRMFLFEVASLVTAGQEVFHSADPGQPAGMVVDAVTPPGGVGTALVEVKLATLEEGTLHLGQAQGPALKQLPLPYELQQLTD